MTRGSLTVVGTGIALVAHVTHEARAALSAADELLYLVPDPVAAAWLDGLNPRARSLHRLYEPGPDRRVAYAAIVDEIVASVRRDSAVCAAFYGHPGVFVHPAHESMRVARSEGYDVRMLPGISADACLFADLGVDPGLHGCQSYEATDLLLHRRTIEPRAGLILWQVGGVGDIGYPPRSTPDRLQVLVDYLHEFYPRGHGGVLYRASRYALCEPSRVEVTLDALPAAEVPAMATLYVPPVPTGAVDVTMLTRLGMQ